MNLPRSKFTEIIQKQAAELYKSEVGPWWVYLFVYLTPLVEVPLVFLFALFEPSEKSGEKKSDMCHCGDYHVSGKCSCGCVRP